MQLFYKQISNNPYSPIKGTDLAAGFDLHSSIHTIVPSKGVKCINTDLEVILPTGYYGRIAARSGMCLKSYITVIESIIEGKCENVNIILYNFGERDYKVQRGDRIAQLICEKYFYDCNKRKNDVPFLSSEVIPSKKSSAIFYALCPVEIDIPSKSVVSIPINIQMNLPSNNYYGRITSIPEMSINSHVIVLEDVITKEEEKENYKITLYNFSNTNYKINKSDGIAQIICEKIINPVLSELSINVEKELMLENFYQLYFKKLSNVARAPTQSQLGFNLYSPRTETIPSDGVICINTNLQIILPNIDCYGRIASTRENIKNFTTVLGGVVDKDYKGDVGVILYNFGKTDRTIHEGDIIARLICENICYPQLTKLISIKETVNNMSIKKFRGTLGFGSSGGYNVVEKKK